MRSKPNPITPAEFVALIKSQNAAKAVDADSLTLTVETFEGLNLEDVELTRAAFTGVTLNKAVLQNLSLERANIEDSEFSGGSIIGSSFEGSRLHEVTFGSVKIEGLDLSNATISDLHIQDCMIPALCLDRAYVTGSTFTDLKGALSAQNAAIYFSRFARISPPHARDTGHLNFRRAELFDCTFEGLALPVSFHQATLFKVRFKNCDLSNATFIGAAIEDCTFENCNLNKADFRRTGIRDCKFSDPQALYSVDHIAYVSFPYMSTRNDILTARINERGDLLFQAGCFEGDAAALKSMIGDKPHYEAYRQFAAVIERLYAPIQALRKPEPPPAQPPFDGIPF